MRIQHNIPGMRTLRYGRKLNNSTAKALEKLSSGYCINRAGDDAAGLAVSERIRMNLTEFGRCKDNIQEGIDLTNTADAALQEVNDMLNRAQELCVAAANGTYSEQEKAELQKELDALYSEVDRIFESSRFNEVELFRHEDYDYSNGRFEYIENVIETSVDDLQEWGVLEGIDQEFGPASQAHSATATLTLDSDVQIADDLVGKSFTIGNYKVNFTSGSETGYPFSTDLSIGIRGCTTVQDAFNKLCKATRLSTFWTSTNTSLEKAEVAGRNVTFTFEKKALSKTIQFDNSPEVTYEIANGTGAISNNIAISSREDINLDAVGIGSKFTATASFQLVPGKADAYTLDDADKDLLRSDSLYFAGTRFNFVNGTGSGSNIGLDGITTAGQLRTAVVDAINSYFIDKGKSINVTAPSTDGTVNVTYTDYPSGTWIYESPPSSSQSEYKDTVSLDGIVVTETVSADGETREVTTIQLPEEFPDSHFSIKINDSIYFFYDSADLKPGYTASGHYDISNKTDDEIYSKILSLIKDTYKKDAEILSTGERQITITAKNLNKNLAISVSSEAYSGTNGMFTYKPASQSNHLLLNDYKYFNGYSVTLDIAAAVNSMNSTPPSKPGFQLNGTVYQLVTGTAAIENAVAIDVSDYPNQDAIKASFEAAIPNSTAQYNPDGTLTISGTVANYSLSALKFEEGYTGSDGLFNETAGTTDTVKSSGGTEVGHPSATIDFSKYNKDNFRELYGKGFRVTCATCKGEYINVIFCYDKAQADFPESFPHQYTDSNGQTVTRTIHNLAVELKNMNNGSDIVNAIVAQLTGELNHYTGVKQGTPASILEVFDRRPGNQPNPAQIISGVKTNCIYTVEEQFVPAPDAVLGDIEIDYRFVKIYTNSESDNEYIDIHLPYLTLENLKLDPPKPDLSTTESATETLEHAKAANNAISFVRGTLGADCNRLEHAYADLAQAEEQAADAFSRIRDTDMAELMMEQTKLSILMQAQQAAQTHTMQQPQSVLKLMQ